MVWGIVLFVIALLLLYYCLFCGVPGQMSREEEKEEEQDG